MNNWQLIWWRRLWAWGHGFWPRKEGKFMPIYEWWTIGPLEIKHFIPRTIDMEYVPVLDFTRPNGKRECMRCGVPVTEENDSGWEGFVTSTLTQPICKTCDSARPETLQKETD